MVYCPLKSGEGFVAEALDAFGQFRTESSMFKNMSQRLVLDLFICLFSMVESYDASCFCDSVTMVLAL
jgi:hypothetical protein